MQIGRYDFDIVSDYDVKLEATELKEDYLKLKITVHLPVKCVPAPVRIEWSIPCCNIFSQWSPMFNTEHTLNPAWNPTAVRSRSAYSAPVQTHISMDGVNKCTVALNDAKTPCEIRSGIYEENASIRYKVILFAERINAITDYCAEMIIDTRSIPFGKAINDVCRWWEECGYGNAYTPDTAKEPMYSTWYAYHQDIVADELIDELKIAKSYGIECVIVDDGWQTKDNNRGYAHCGDWKAERISDMCAFVKKVHDIGMKYIMWYSVPFVGKHSNAAELFSDMLLSRSDKGWGVLDPRYGRVREYLVGIYENAVKDWDLDGLKLDFIDSFELTAESTYKDEMDFESLEDGICALIAEIKKRLTAIKPDIMIEFRQNYIGPVMRKYGNILRVADCPADALKNRVCGINLRLSSGACTVHSDMLMWNVNDSVQSAALQLINVLFLVPQISVRLQELNEEHKKMLRFFLGLWKQHKNCLLDGELIAYNPEANYSLVISKTDVELTAVAYSTCVLNLDAHYQTVIFVNGTGTDSLIVCNNTNSYIAQIKVCSCMGEIETDIQGEIRRGLNLFKVPKSGLIEICAKSVL